MSVFVSSLKSVYFYLKMNHPLNILNYRNERLVFQFMAVAVEFGELKKKVLFFSHENIQSHIIHVLQGTYFKYLLYVVYFY